MFKRTGDGALVEFRSVVEAVRSAITIQNAMIERNIGMPADQCIVSALDLSRLHDRLYRLEAAVEDVRADLADASTPADYRRAVDHLLDASDDLVGTVVEPVRA